MQLDLSFTRILIQCTIQILICNKIYLTGNYSHFILIREARQKCQHDQLCILREILWCVIEIFVLTLILSKVKCLTSGIIKQIFLLLLRSM